MRSTAVMIGRAKTPHRVLVVPYGTGIGDMVNMRPLLLGIAAAHPDCRIDLLADRSLGWLAPPGISLVPSVHGVRPWRRPAFGGAVQTMAGRLPVPRAARILRPLLGAPTARLMTRYLGMQEYPIVYNLVELLAGLDRIAQRWLPDAVPDGPNLLDLLAGALEARGVGMPPAERTPRLDITPEPLGAGPRALIAPSAGTTLKEAPPDLWREIVSRLHLQGVRSHVVVAPGRATDPLLLDAAPDIVQMARPLRQLLPAIAGAGVVITPDSGLLHLAAATGTPYVGLFGSTSPAFSGPRPRAGGVLIQSPYSHPEVCRDCWTAQMLPTARCAVFHPTTCLSAITPDTVVSAATELMRRHPRPPGPAGA